MTDLKDDIFRENGEGFFLRIIESAPLGILVFNSMGRIVFLNNNFLELCVYHQLEINPSNTIDLFEVDLFRDNHLLDHFQKLRDGYSFEEEIEGLKKFSLRKIYLLLKGVPLYKNDKFDGGILILQDIKIGEEEKPLASIDNRWQDILNTAFDLLLITDETGNIKFSLGKRAKKFLSRISPFEEHSINNLFSQEINTLLNSYVKIVRESNASQKFNLQLIINNRPHDYECEIEPVLDEEKKIKLLFFRFTDIRTHVKAQKLLEQKILELSKQHDYLEQINVPIFVIDLTGKILYWNKVSQDYFGYSEVQAMNRYFVRLIGIIEPNYFENIKKEVLQQKQAQSIFRFISLEGKEETLRADFILIDDAEQQILVTCKNISDIVELEEKVKAKETRLKNIIKNIGDVIFSFSAKGKIIDANEKFLELLNISKEEVAAINISQFLEQDFLTNNSLSKIEIDDYERIEISLRSESRRITLSGYLKRSRDSFGEEIFTGYFQDISPSKDFSDELNILSSIFNAAKDGFAVELENKIISVNNSFTNIFGYSRKEELTGLAFIQLVADEDVIRISEYLHLIRRNLDAPDRFEFLGKLADGSTTYFSSTVSTFQLKGKNYLLYVTRNISETKRSQQALRESEEKYRNLIENIDDFFYTYSRVRGKLRPVFYTSSVQKITGYSQAELITDQRLFFKIILPDDIHTVKQKVKSLLKSRIKNSDEVEFRIINRYGNIAWVRNKINVIRDEQGDVRKIFGIVSDISIRKKVEEDLMKSKEDLIKLNETKDRFLSIVSHDLRTPFSSILGFTELLLKDETLTEKERNQYVKFIQESSNSMLSLVNSLLDWNRLQSGRIQFEPEKTYANSIIESSIGSLAGAALRKKIEFKSTISKEIQIFVDENLILQVFNNLISNAIKFTNTNGTISISVKPSQRLRFLEFSIKDTGVGIKSDDIKKLFSIDSKFTRDGTSGEKGSGMGLTIVNDIIQKHGGSIWAESEPGKGATFKFTLPIASAVILLVDDNKTDRLLYSKILRNITPDYNVEIASNGKEAMDKIIKSPPALVISDHNMPEMNGIQLVQEIQKLEAKAKPPIIILSGDIDRTAIHDYGLLGIDYIFQKPVNLANFKQAVERTIRKGLLGE
jgi:PAS domain S-box-containing protein